MITDGTTNFNLWNLLFPAFLPSVWVVLSVDTSIKLINEIDKMSKTTLNPSILKKNPEKCK